jgi:hypothetical protein
MNSEIKKVKDLEVGKYYKEGSFTFIRVEDGIDEDKYGTTIKILDWIVSVELECKFFDIDENNSLLEGYSYTEITQEEFEQKLQEAQEEFTKICNIVKDKQL